MYDRFETKAIVQKRVMNMTLVERLNKVQVPLTNAAVSVLLIRLFLSFEWLNSGTGKIQSILSNPDAYFGGLSKVFAAVWTKSNPYPFMVDFLTNTAATNASTVVTAIAVTEVFVGISLLLGILTRVGAFGGIVMNIIFYLAAGHTSPSTAGVNLVMIGAQLATIAAPGGRVLGLDAILHRKFARVPLW
jgi:thiosulfate dehydrogenase [quinone] large subunit